jgi:type I restriction enzyme S subunit
VGYHDVGMAKDGVVTGRSGTIGQVYCIRGEYWPLNTALFSMDTHGNNIVYLSYMLRYFDVTRFYNGTGVPTLNRNDVHKEKIYDIPVEEQERFARFAEQSNKSKFVCVMK